MDFRATVEQARRGELQFIEVPGAVAVTKLETSGDFGTCYVLAVAGDLSKIEALNAKIEEHARAAGCNCIEMQGRPGWSRVYQRFPGYRPVAVTYRKDLEA